MEPMALGSPSHDSPQKPIYLPGYLMGERAQSPMGNVSISTMSPLRANRSHTPDVHTTFLMRNFHHELSDKPYAFYIMIGLKKYFITEFCLLFQIFHSYHK